LQTRACFAGLIVLAGLVLVSCGSAGGRDVAPATPEGEECPPERCLPIAQAREQAGFEIWEPRFLPEGFELYERKVTQLSLGSAPPGTQPHVPPDATTPEVEGLPSTVGISYRFRGSENVPPISISESISAPEGRLARLIPTHPDCGELSTTLEGMTFYVSGLAFVEPGVEEGEVMVCQLAEEPARRSHTVLLTRGNVLIQMYGFSEAGVTKEQILRVAASFVKAE
jgi:hypothetical protein